MTTSIRIGHAGRAAFTLPADVQTVTTAVLGIRGSGKTTTGRVVVEGLVAAGRQVVIIDPTDVWWGLRSSADGQKAGLPVVVAGGDHGQVPLSANDGHVLADFIVQERASMVLSLRHLRKGDQRSFVTAFAEQLYHRKGAARTPVLVVIDECDTYIPQRVGGAEARMVGAIEDLVRKGRAAGIGVLLISQRAASVNKDVLTQIELLVAHRHTSPQDRAALEAWVEAHDTDDKLAEFNSQLAGLDRGTAWFWSPGWLDVFCEVAVRLPTTFDSSATPAPGRAAVAPKAASEVDLEGLRTKLATTVAEAEANDPKKLRAEIAKLKAEVVKGEQARQKPAPDQAVIDRAVRAAMGKRDEQWRTAIKAYRRELVQYIDHEIRPPDTMQVLSDGNPPLPKLSTRQSPLPDRPAARQPTPRPARGASDDDSLSGLERALLTVLAQHPDGLTKGAACVYAGYAPSGPVSTAWARFNAGGWTQRTADGVRITDEGLDALGGFDPLPTGAALREHWLGKSSGLEAALLGVLFDRYPGDVTKGEACEAAGYKPSGPVSTAWAKFNRLGWIQRTARGVKASAMWFE